MFDPGSVAVVGASESPRKWGYWLATGALAGRDRRAVHLVNRRGGALGGVPFRPSLDALGARPEHVVVAVPPPSVRQTVLDGLAVGARQFTVVTSGAHGEEGPASAPAEERALAALVAAHGGRLLGPNCMGVVDTGTELNLTWGEFPRGDIGLVSQSGNLALELARLLRRSGQGISRFVSLGNQRGIDAADVLDSLVGHEPTRVIAAYIEDFRDGRRLARTLAAARDAGKPVLLLTVGRSAASGRAAASHTGALVSARATVRSMCQEAGALLLDSAGELVDTAVALLSPARATGRRVAVAGDSGGQGALAADELAERGLDVAEPSPDTAEALSRLLPAGAARGNPVDLAGAGEADLTTYARVARTLLTGDADAAVLTGYFGDYASDNPEHEWLECAVATELADAVGESGRPLVVHTMARDTAALRLLRSRGVPVYERVEQAAAALANAVRWAEGTRLDDGAPPPGPDPDADGATAAPVCDGGYRTLRELLGARGIVFPEAEFVTTADEAAEAAGRVGFPLVLKAMGLAHKTEAGGVALGIGDEARLRAAFARMSRATAAGSYAVEAMARIPHAVELIAGVRHDPAFGPVLMAGIGGVTAELLADTALCLAPVTHARARNLLLSLRHAPLLHGWRGAPSLDVDAAARALTALARVAVEHPELAELEVNPLLVHPSGAVALDAHGVLARDGTAP
ncbi:acetate--CoA ligase family protein [Streptomyces sp. HNM0574]|nr:acetate--CoA ligase family protein [Streptomyces sp. HNM0574]NLU70652.1 acetate--CoA ligase family protein [Streptomyces sp. HNM0574]